MVPVITYKKLFDKKIPNKYDYSGIACARIPIGLSSWSILNQSAEYELLKIAKDIALKGVDEVLNKRIDNQVVWAPVVNIKDGFKVIDRRELESYRAVYQLLKKPAKNPQKRPTSIAVFGPPGSGKSFLVKSIADSLDIENLERHDVNVAKMSDSKELIKKLEEIKEKIHKAPDRVDLIFFDEFDSTYNGIELGWIKYFLPYMEDWYDPQTWEIKKAKDHAKEGKLIFVFAGGTSTNYLDFTREDLSISEQQKAQFKMAKGPDFVSRLLGHVNILGPNRVDEFDDLYVLRRALLLRNTLTQALGNDLTDKIEDKVIEKLLTVSSYKHGAPEGVTGREKGSQGKGLQG